MDKVELLLAEADRAFLQASTFLGGGKMEAASFFQLLVSFSVDFDRCQAENATSDLRAAKAKKALGLAKL